VDVVDSQMLAVTAYQEAVRYCPLHAVGIGATSCLQKLELEDDLQTYKPERDNRRHEIHVSVHTRDLTASWSLVSQGPISEPEALRSQDLGQAALENRLWEEFLNSLMIIKALGYVCGEDVPIFGHENELMHKSTRVEDIHPAMSALIQRQIPYVTLKCGKGDIYAMPPDTQIPIPRLIVSGSFNPVHLGHHSMAQVSSQRTSERPFYEMPISNADKGWLDFITIQDRLEHFRNLDHPVMVLLTNAPTFLEKSRLFPNSTFALGMDTFVRLINPKYYPQMNLDEAAAQFVLNRNKFLVFGRRDRQTDHFIDSPEAMTVHLGVVTPTSFLDISQFIPEAEYSVDLASSDIRKGGAA
jgi:hypothetical protein